MSEFDGFLVDFDGPLGRTVPAEEGLNPSPTSLHQVPGEVRVGEDAFDCIGESFRVARGHQDACIPHDLWDRPRLGGDNRGARGHSFRKNYAKSLLEGGVNEQFGLPIEVRKLLVCDVSQEVYQVCDTEIACETLQSLGLPPVTHGRGAKFPPSVSHSPQGMQEVHVALSIFVRTHTEDCWKSCWMARTRGESSQVYSMRYDANLLVSDPKVAPEFARAVV